MNVHIPAIQNYNTNDIEYYWGTTRIIFFNSLINPMISTIFLTHLLNKQIQRAQAIEPVIQLVSGKARIQNRTG